MKALSNQTTNLSRERALVGRRDVAAAAARTTAEVTDRKGALHALGRRCKPRLGLLQSLLADSGYVGQPFARACRTSSVGV